jgi:uncharacterized protein with GYD domain
VPANSRGLDDGPRAARFLQSQFADQPGHGVAGRGHSRPAGHQEIGASAPRLFDFRIELAFARKENIIRALTEAVLDKAIIIQEETMMLRTLITVTALTAVLSGTALSQPQGNLHRYVSFFKYSSAAIKAMTETPQDRSVGVRKLAEGVGGKVDNIYFLPLGGEYDGFVIWDLPDDLAAGATYMTTQATGNFDRLQVLPLMNAEQFKAVMEKAKQIKGGYSPPSATTAPAR